MSQPLSSGAPTGSAYTPVPYEPNPPLSANGTSGFIHTPETGPNTGLPLTGYHNQDALAIAPNPTQPIPTPLPSPGLSQTTKKSSPTNTIKKGKKNNTTQQTKEARAAAIKKVTEARNTVPPTMQPVPVPKVATSARSDARDLWWFLLALEKKVEVTREALQDLIRKAREFQENAVFDNLQHPKEDELLCIPCLLKGVIKYFHNHAGGITGQIREHMEKYHSVPYYTKCLQEGLKHRCKNASLDGINGGQPEFTFSGFLSRLTSWIVVDDQPFNVVENPEFCDHVLFTGQGHLQDKDVPHRNKIVAAAEAMYYVEKELIDLDMRAARGFISLTSDLWSDPILHSFMAVTAHYIDQSGLLKDHLIAFRKIDGSHSGTNLANAMFKILRESGIADKVGYVTLDNASNNNTMMRELARTLNAHGLAFDADLNRLRCFPHILNLAVQAITSALPVSAKKHRQYMEEAGLFISSAEDRYLDALDSDPLEAIRTSINACRASGTRREEFSRLIELGNEKGSFHLPDGTPIIISNRQLLRDSPTRWGSTYSMSGRYIELFPAIVELSYQSRTSVHIPFITHAQYEVVQDLLTVLSIGYNAQELLSAEKTPTLSLVFPLFESIIQSWKQLAINIPELKHAISCGIEKIYDYMGRANKVPAHTIAMFLNPMFKMDWFYSKWEDKDAKDAESMIKAKMLRVQQIIDQPPRYTYLSTPAHQAARAQALGYMRVLLAGTDLRRASDRQANPIPTSSDNTSPLESSQDNLTTQPTTAPDAHIRNCNKVDEEYQLYVQDGTVDPEKMKEGFEIVRWWVENRYKYPILYHMAMNILPAQASSVSSERVFSSSKLTCTPERNRLSVDNMEFLQVLKHALRRRRRDAAAGIVIPTVEDGLDFVSHVFDNTTNDDDDKDNDLM